MRTDTETLIKALEILVDDIQSVDGVANAAIAEAAQRLSELNAENAKFKKDAAKIRVEAIKEAATMCCPVSGYVVRDDQARRDLMQYADFLEKTESE